MWHLYIVISAIPTIGMVLCLFIAGVWHHEDTNYSHCGVFNFWPSISAAVGNNNPERFIWRLAVGLHNVVSFADSYVLYDRLYLLSGRAVLSRLAGMCKMLSALALFVLSFVTSTEIYSIHKLGFLSWVVFGALSIVLFVYTWRSSVDLSNAHDRFVWKWLTVCTGGYFGFLILTGIFFYLHNATCWPLMYSGFGFCEFIVIMCYILGLGLGPVIAFNYDARVIISDAKAIKF